MRTKASRIRWAREDVALTLGVLEGQDMDVYSFDTLIDVADEYLGFLEDAAEYLDAMKECLSKAVMALDELEGEEAAGHALKEIGHTLEAVDGIQKIIDEVGP